MAPDILSELSPLPMRLLDLVVAESGGIPLYIEAFIRLLMERGVITVGERRRVDKGAAAGMHPPTGALSYNTQRRRTYRKSANF